MLRTQYLTFIEAVCCPGGFLEQQGEDISSVGKIIPSLVRLLQAFRGAGFPVYHTREGTWLHRLAVKCYAKSYKDIVTISPPSPAARRSGPRTIRQASVLDIQDR